MELRIFRTWSWVPDNQGRLGGPLQYKLVHQDKLQYRPVTGSGDWSDIPVVEGEKPQHPNDIKRAQEIANMNKHIDGLIAEGKIKLPEKKV